MPDGDLIWVFNQTEMSSSSTSLDAAATARKARLAKLASLKRKQPSQDDEATAGPPGSDPGPFSRETNTAKYLSGRNYDPETRGPKLGFENAPVEGKDTLELRARSVADAARDKEEKERREEKPLDLFTLQPKKPNWDLKRDLAKKTDILDQRTDNAIARLVRERIEGQKRKNAEKANEKRNGSDGDNVGITGVDLVEGVKVREREEAEDERREQDDQDEEL